MENSSVINSLILVNQDRAGNREDCHLRHGGFHQRGMVNLVLPSIYLRARIEVQDTDLNQTLESTITRLEIILLEKTSLYLHGLSRCDEFYVNDQCLRRI